VSDPPSIEKGCRATPPALRTAATVLVRLDRQMQLFVAVLEPEIGDFHAIQA